MAEALQQELSSIVHSCVAATFKATMDKKLAQLEADMRKLGGQLLPQQLR